MAKHQTPELLSVQQAADLLGVSRKTVYRYMYESDPPLASLRAGHTIVIERSALDEFVKASRKGERTLKAVMNARRK